MGSGASIDTAAADNWPVDKAIDALLPFYEQDTEKCLQVHNALMKRVCHPGTGIVDRQNPPSSNSSFGKEIIDALNQVRTDPSSFINHAQQHLQSFTDEFIHKDKHNRPNMSIKTKEGRAAVMECIEFLKHANPCEPLQLNTILERCAADYVTHVCSATYRSSQAEPIGDRFSKYGNWKGTIGEVVSFGDSKAIDIVLSLLIDDGAVSRGNRASVFEPSYTQAGAAIINADKDDGNSCCVIEFAAAIYDWNLFERRDVIVSSGVVDPDSGLDGGVVDSNLFDRVVASIPIDDAEPEVRRMMSEEGIKRDHGVLSEVEYV